MKHPKGIKNHGFGSFDDISHISPCNEATEDWKQRLRIQSFGVFRENLITPMQLDKETTSLLDPWVVKKESDEMGWGWWKTRPWDPSWFFHLCFKLD